MKTHCLFLVYWYRVPNRSSSDLLSPLVAEAAAKPVLIIAAPLLAALGTLEGLYWQRGEKQSNLAELTRFNSCFRHNRFWRLLAEAG